MKKSWLLPISFLVLLAACVPVTRTLPPDTPIVYPTGYRSLFDATLQELTAAYVPDRLERRTFTITKADPDIGLITAVRSERGESVNLNYRFPGYRYGFGDGDEDTHDFPYGLGFRLALPVPVSPTLRTVITAVVRPQGEGASLIYSTQGPNGNSSSDAERLMQQVVEKLDARFTAAQTPMEPLKSE